jgi:hypothetical protein
VTGPRRTSPVPRTTFWPFRAHYAEGFFNARFRFPGAFRGLRRLNSGSTPSCPALRQVLADDACRGLATSHSLRTGQLFRPASHPASRPRTGASLPGTRTSPRARPTLAGCLSCHLVTSCHRMRPSVMAPKLLGTRSRVPYKSQHHVLAPFTPDTAWPAARLAARLIPGHPYDPGSDVVVLTFDASSEGSLSLNSVVHT